MNTTNTRNTVKIILLCSPKERTFSAFKIKLHSYKFNKFLLFCCCFFSLRRRKKNEGSKEGFFAVIFSRCLFIVSTLQDQQVLATLVCVCSCNTHTHTCACSHMGSYNLKSTPTIARRGRTRPGRKKKKSTKATVSASAWTCRLCGLVSPGSQETPPLHSSRSPAFPPFFFFPPTSANFPCSHCSITQNECQSFHPAVGSKQTPPPDKTAAVCRHDQRKTMTDVSMWLGEVKTTSRAHLRPMSVYF